jgi:hypothetical protein
MIQNTLGTDLEVANAALSLFGEVPMQSFQDSSPAANILSRIYEPTMRGALASMRWRFNMKQVVLTRVQGAPARRFSAWYQMPTDSLNVHSVSVGDREIEFDVFGDRIHCNADVNDQVVAEYSWRAPENRWTAQFTAYAVNLLAAEVAAGVTSKIEFREGYMNTADYFRRMAASMEAQNRTPAKLDTSAFVRRRRGGR